MVASRAQSTVLSEAHGAESATESRTHRASPEAWKGLTVGWARGRVEQPFKRRVSLLSYPARRSEAPRKERGASSFRASIHGPLLKSIEQSFKSLKRGR